MQEEFTNRWEKVGFTQQEAEEKKAKVDDGYGVNSPESEWKPAVVVPDPEKGGYKVVIQRK